VLLRWKTGHEVDNLGFHLYRQEGRKLTRITPDLIAGSALLVGERAALTAGRSYRCLDPAPPPGRPRYWLEDVDLEGSRRRHGPAEVLDRDPVRSLGVDGSRSPLLGLLDGAARRPAAEREPPPARKPPAPRCPAPRPVSRCPVP